MNPSGRSLAGIGLILLLILVWSVIAVSAYGLVAGTHWLVQALFFIVAGTIWVLPLKPLIKWMNGASDGT